jgi:hypothetical protein
MKAIANPINRNSQGTEVSNLQEVLLLLLRRQLIRVADEDRPSYEEGLLREQREQTYNDITQRVVGIFQEESRLTITGDVDEPTAAALTPRESLASGVCPAVGPSTTGGVRLSFMASTIDNRGHSARRPIAKTRAKTPAVRTEPSEAPSRSNHCV